MVEAGGSYNPSTKAKVRAASVRGLACDPADGEWHVIGVSFGRLAIEVLVREGWHHCQKVVSDERRENGCANE